MPNKIVFMGALVNYPQQPSFTGSIIKEYSLVVNPEDNVRQQIIAEKEKFYEQYGKQVANKTNPHITVAGFVAKEEMEDTLLRWMHRIINSFKIFSVSLNNYSGLPNVATVYLRVQDHTPFKQLAKELKVIDELIRSNGLPKATLISNPHLTIARSLHATVYEKAMMEYSKKDFHAEFEVKELVLLKRTNQFDACQQVSVFRLQ